MKLLLLALPLAALALVAARSPVSPAGNGPIREELDAVYGRWEKARTSFDTATFEQMLAPDFYCQIGPQKLTRAQFLAEISVKQPGAELARFDSDILTLHQDKDGAWVAVIEEKLEFELEGPAGKPSRVYSLWVTNDRLEKTGEAWQVLSSEAIGNENWNGGELPPFADWKS
jgi:hypothetical protein